MAYTSFSFPASTHIFPRASIVLEYLNDYAGHFHLTPHIRLNTTVKAVHRDPPNSRWKVTLSTNSNSDETLPFDLVLVCNGHYRIPRYPEVPGLAKWLQAGKATHSAYYRRPHNLGKVVLVIGGGPSGLDISEEMCSFADTVIHSATGASHGDIGNLKRRGCAVQFHEIEGDGKGQVTFEDGTTEYGIDHCILATGYEFSFPFFSDDAMRSVSPPPAPPLPQDLYNTKSSIFPLTKHIFPLLCPSTATNTTDVPPWSMAFMGRILARVAPFPLLEAQAHAILHYFAHPESLDPTQEAMGVMARYEALHLKLASDDPLTITKAWHKFEPLEQFAYRDALHEFASSSWIGKGCVKVSEWEKEMYLNRELLRKVWVELERREEAGDWVRGVGEGDREGEEGKREWVGVMMRMLGWAKEVGKKL